MTKRTNKRSGANNIAVLRENEDGFDLRLSGIVGDTSFDLFEDGFSSDKVDELLAGVEGPGTVRINSPGGAVFEGIAIYNMLRNFSGVTTRVEGLAASIASIIAMAGERVEMERGAQMMIHNPWNIAMGDSRELRKSADVLDKIRESLLDIYQTKSGLERDFIAEMLDEETWLTADEAVEFGFADAAVGENEAAAQARIDRLDLSILVNAQHAPERIAAMATDSAKSRKHRAATPANPETEESTMSTETKQAPAAPETANPKAETQEQNAEGNAPASPSPKAETSKASNDAEQAAAKAVSNERSRCNTIRTQCAEKKLPEAFAQRLIDDGIELDQAKIQINNLAEFMNHDPAKHLDSHPNSIEITRDERDTQRAAVSSALLHRYNARQYKLAADDPGREFANLSLREVARAMAEANGTRTKGMTAHQVAKAAMHSTSDFPMILENVVGKTLRDAYELAPRTFVPLARQTTLPDYKEVSRTQMGEAPELQKVLEGGEYTYGTVGEAAEKYRLFKYGKVLAITSETIINDDLDAFTRVPALMGAAAGQLESSLFWAHVTGNPAMQDGNNLFSAAHNNLQNTGSAIGVDSIGEGRKFMRQQKGLDGEHFINVQPSFLVVPTALETKAEQQVSTNLQADSAGNINPFAGRLQVISEPRLDAASGTAWYLWADPNMVDTVEFAFLQGEEGPQVETEDGFDVDGTKIKVRHNFGVKAIDWRGMFRNDGA